MTARRIRLLALVDNGFVPWHAQRLGPSYDAATGDTKWFQDNIPCQATCPAHTNVPSYIAMIADQRYDASYQLNWEANVFPGCLGHVCARPCEDACRRRFVDAPVSICGLKRTAADLRRQSPHSRTPWRPGGSVGIVGAGVAGLAAARELAQAGHAVVVYERQPVPGGMLWAGVPDWRLPRAAIREEVETISSLGVELRFGISVGDDLTLAELSQRHDALLIATGCQQSTRLRIPGEESDGVESGLSYLRRFNLGQRHELEQPGRVITIGGGYTSIDCVRTVVRLGAERSVLAYRRGPDEMPVTTEEIEEAQTEGVEFLFLASPGRIVSHDGHVTGVEFTRNRPIAGGTGRRGVEPIPGSEFVVPCDRVIVAIGQQSQRLAGLDELDLALDERGQPVVDRDGRTSHLAVWVAGDYVTGPRNFISAIADGKRAAGSIDRALRGTTPDQANGLELVSVSEPEPPLLRQLIDDGVAEWSLTTLDRRLQHDDDYDEVRRQPMSLRPVAERGIGQARANYPTVELGFSAEIAAEEARRCLQCQLNIFIDGERCILCNGCVEVCPYDCIEMVPIERVASLDGDPAFAATAREHFGTGAVAMLIDEERCIRCGRCVERCPTGCLSMQHFRPAPQQALQPV